MFSYFPALQGFLHFPRACLLLMIIVPLDVQGCLILVLSVVQLAVSVEFCGLEYRMDMVCDSFVMVLNCFLLFYTFSSLIPREKVTGSSCFISSMPLIIVYACTHVYKAINSFISSTLIWVISVAFSYSVESPLVSVLFTVLIASPFLVHVSLERFGTQIWHRIHGLFPSSTG